MRTEVVGMGFSVSGTYALLFFGVLFAMGTLHASASNAVEEVRDAQQVQNDHLSAIQRTDVNVTDVILLDATSCDVNVTANNTGTTQLRVSETDLFSDGTYEENLTDRAQVDGTDEPGRTTMNRRGATGRTCGCRANSWRSTPANSSLRRTGSRSSPVPACLTPRRRLDSYVERSQGGGLRWPASRCHT